MGETEGEMVVAVVETSSDRGPQAQIEMVLSFFFFWGVGVLFGGADNSLED